MHKEVGQLHAFIEALLDLCTLENVSENLLLNSVFKFLLSGLHSCEMCNTAHILVKMSFALFYNFKNCQAYNELTQIAALNFNRADFGLN